MHLKKVFTTFCVILSLKELKKYFEINKDTNMISKDPLLFIPADKNKNICKDS